MSDESQPASDEWQMGADEDGETYFFLPSITDKYGRPVRYRERHGHSSRVSRRALGIRTPLLALQAWEQAMNDAWKELLNEEQGTQGDTLGGESDEEDSH